MSMTEIIRIMRVKRGNISERELAALVGDTPQNINNKMKRDNFKVNELEKISDALGYKMVITFIDKETGEHL